LVVVGEDKNLRFASQTAKGAGVQDAIAVPFETGPKVVGLLVDGAVSGADGSGRSGRELFVEIGFASLSSRRD
jgi:hypothetical protein